MASLESYAQQADSVLLANLSYQLPVGASYVTNRQSVYWLTSSAGTFTAQGVRHCKVSMTAEAGHYADRTGHLPRGAPECTASGPSRARMCSSSG